MSESGKAVFLSYASQDAEAAKKICEALRAAGVEVWFDQSELVGGDAWDQKIRKQIRECVLFIPILSQTTQGRREAYFRLEWKLADERTHLMARGTPFLLPVTIDATNDRNALVPDSFLAVQWTKLPGGETPPAFSARVKRLLDGDSAEGGGSGRVGGALRPDASAESAHKAPSTHETVRWLKPVLASAAVVIAVLAFTLMSRRAPDSAAVPPAVPVPAPAPAAVTPSVSPVRELVAKARELVLALDATREDFALAEEYCQRAIKLDPDDGEAWAVYSQVNSAFGYRGWDTSPERREQTRTTAERAMRLAPQSANARLAQAGAWSTFGINRDEREKLLREIVRDDPANQDALRFLAVTVLPKPGGLEEALALNERSAALPGGDPLALFNNARYLWTAGQPAKGYEVLLRSLAQRKFTSALVLKMGMELTWRGDLAAAEETLKQIPPSALQEDRANYSAGLLRYYQRDAAGALAAWGAFPRDFYVDFIFDGPKGLLLGLADELDHRDVAARTEWRAALREVEKKIAAAPNRAGPYYSQAYLLACLGEKAAAGEALRTHEQLAQIKYAPGQGMTLPLAKVYARLGRFDEIFDHFSGSSPVLRISPDFDALRTDPRFQTWSKGRAAAKALGSLSVAVAEPDQKSVAVLAFANLSDDKANEYFSDGISEELLNVLAKVPGLKVTARTSSFHFKGKDTPIPEIAQRLGVAYVVEGSVRRQGDKVRITAQLIKARDGFQVWSDSFTRDLKDIFDLQDEIASLIAKNLSLQLGVSASGAHPVDPEAYRLLTFGRALVYTNSGSDGAQARKYLSDAVARDRNFALAWAWLAYAYWTDSANGWIAVDQGFQSARAAAEKALAVDPNLSEAHAAMGMVQYGYDWDWAGARTSLRRAEQLMPGSADVISNLTRLAITLGENDEAVRLGHLAVELDPFNPYAQYALCMTLFQAGRFEELASRMKGFSEIGPTSVKIQVFSRVMLGQNDEALAIAKRMDTTSYNRPFLLSLAEWATGHPAEADVALNQLKVQASDRAAYQIAQLYGQRGAVDDALAWLETAYRLRDTGMIWVKNDPFFRSLHADPRWQALLKKMNLADIPAP